jgi:hypothetical protein
MGYSISDILNVNVMPVLIIDTGFWMAKKGKAKKRGRPYTGGRGTPVLVRLHDKHLEALDEWRERQDGGSVSRAEALRRLMVLGLFRCS